MLSLVIFVSSESAGMENYSGGPMLQTERTGIYPEAINLEISSD